MSTVSAKEGKEKTVSLQSIAALSTIFFIAAFVLVFPLWQLNSPRSYLRNQQSKQSPASEWSFDISIDSFDPDLREIQGTITVGDTLDCKQIMAKRNIEGDGRCFAVPVQVEDKAAELALFGTVPVGDLALHELFFVNQEDEKKAVIFDGELSQQQSKFILAAEGNPGRYPFDRYLVIARVDQKVWWMPNKTSGSVLTRERFIPVGRWNEVTDRIPGFNLRSVSENELRDWVLAEKPPDMSDWNTQLYGNVKDYWFSHRVYFEIERPFLLKFLTMAIGLIALVSVIVVAVKTEPQDFMKALAASFLTLWGLRSTLSSGAPKTPTLLDICVLLLFCLQVAVFTVRWVSKSLKNTRKRIGFRSRLQ